MYIDLPYGTYYKHQNTKIKHSKNKKINKSIYQKIMQDTVLRLAMHKNTQCSRLTSHKYARTKWGLKLHRCTLLLLLNYIITTHIME